MPRHSDQIQYVDNLVSVHIDRQILVFLSNLVGDCDQIQDIHDPVVVNIRLAIKLDLNPSAQEGWDMRVEGHGTQGVAPGHEHSLHSPVPYLRLKVICPRCCCHQAPTLSD